MTDERSGSGDPGPIRDVDAEVPVDEDVIDISDDAGREPTANVDDIDPGSSGAHAAGVEPPG